MDILVHTRCKQEPLFQETTLDWVAFAADVDPIASSLECALQREQPGSCLDLGLGLECPAFESLLAMNQEDDSLESLGLLCRVRDAVVLGTRREISLNSAFLRHALDHRDTRRNCIVLISMSLPKLWNGHAACFQRESVQCHYGP